MLDRDGISGDEFDCVKHIIDTKIEQYDSALTELLVSCRHSKLDKISAGQALYWKHCIAALKDTLSYARTQIRVSRNGSPIQSYRADNSEGNATVDSGQRLFWQESESNI